MERRVITPRPDWRAAVERLGLTFHTLPGGRPYWDESAYYEFTAAEVDTLEHATDELMDRCLEAGEWVVRNRRWDFYPGLRPEWIHFIERSWDQDEGQLLGRFDLAFDGLGPPKLLEFNADTPTALLEASVVQWYWLEERFPGADQFNSLHERLVARWRALFPDYPDTMLLHGACLRDAPEDETTVRYLLETARQAGLATAFTYVEDIGAGNQGRFYDGANRPITNLFKLYPWEWLLRDAYGPLVPRSGTRFLEPAWKLLFSHKGLLAVLWHLFPGHPNLLPATLDPAAIPAGLRGVVRKPVLGREGRNVTILSADQRTTLAAGPGGPYGAEGFVYQALGPVPSFDGNHFVLGSWVIGGRAAGLGVRESDGPITDDGSRFVPHLFRAAGG